VPDVKKVEIQDLTPIGPVGYAAAFIGSSALFLVAARAILRTAISGRGLAGLLALLFLLRATLLFTTPIGSDDVYRYLWDGKVQAAALNPYAHAPSSPVLQRLHSDTLPRLVNHPDLKTPYFPLAQWVFWLAYSMSGEAVWGVKLLILLAEALTVAGTILLLRHLGQPLERSLLYAAAPLALFQFAFDGHIDAIGFPFLVFGLLLHLRGRIIAGPALLGLSMSVKPVALLPTSGVCELPWSSVRMSSIRRFASAPRAPENSWVFVAVVILTPSWKPRRAALLRQVTTYSVPVTLTVSAVAAGPK
jgi:hypothetical protein